MCYGDYNEFRCGHSEDADFIDVFCKLADFDRASPACPAYRFRPILRDFECDAECCGKFQDVAWAAYQSIRNDYEIHLMTDAHPETIKLKVDYMSVAWEDYQRLQRKHETCTAKLKELRTSWAARKQEVQRVQGG